MKPRDLLKFAGSIFDDRKKNTVGQMEVERGFRAYRATARLKCLEYRELRYCSECHLSLHAFQSFCEKCGIATEPLPASFAVEYARSDFPDLIKSREDFDDLIA